MTKTAELKNLLAAKGINATDAQIETALTKYNTGKRELGAASLDKVTGGEGNWGDLIKLIPDIVNLFKDLLGGKKDGGGDGESGDPATSFDQNNQHNSGNQVVSQNGNITAGNLSMTKKDKAA